MGSPKTILYTRQGCHLCDEAADLLRANGVQPEMVDVDQDEQLHQRFDQCVPVVEINGKVRFRGQVQPMLLRRVLDAETATDAGHSK